MTEKRHAGEGPANQPSLADPYALLHRDLAETSALLGDCAAIARDGTEHFVRRLPAMGAAAQLARASAQLAKLLTGGKPQSLPAPENRPEIARNPWPPDLERQLAEWRVRRDAEARENFSKTTSPLPRIR